MKLDARRPLNAGQPDLFDGNLPAYRPDSPTSYAAAAAIAPELSVRQREALSALFRHGPLTADAIAERVGRHFMAVRPRVSELLDVGLLEKAGVGKSALGHAMDVVALSAEGTIYCRKNFADVNHGPNGGTAFGRVHYHTEEKR